MIRACPHCLVRFTWQETAADGKVMEPSDGDVGICESCRQWWELRGGFYRRHVPTEEEKEVVREYFKGRQK